MRKFREILKYINKSYENIGKNWEWYWENWSVNDKCCNSIKWIIQTQLRCFGM
jgi:hypothetical protein